MFKIVIIDLPILLNDEQKERVHKYLYFDRENEVIIDNIQFVDMGCFTSLVVFVKFDFVGYINRFEEYVKQDTLEFLDDICK